MGFGSLPHFTPIFIHRVENRITPFGHRRVSVLAHTSENDYIIIVVLTIKVGSNLHLYFTVMIHGLARWATSQGLSAGDAV